MSEHIKLDTSMMMIDDLSSIPELASAAEQYGFDGLWSAETQHDPFLQLALAATSTARIQLGTAIALSFTRSPMSLAYTAWDLGSLTRGRFILGLGTQVKAHNERRFSVEWTAPVPRLRDEIKGLRAIWHAWQSGERLNYRGDHYTFTLMTPFFTPPRHKYELPIYIAGVNTGLARLAGERCDGFHVHPLNSAAYLEQVVRPAIKEGAEEHGRTLADISLSASVFVVTGRNDNEAAFYREMVRQQISFYASTPSYRVILETHGWADIGEELSRLAARKRWDEMAALVTDEMIERFAIVASPQEVGEAALERYAGLVNRITFYLPFQPGSFDDLWKPAIQAFTQQ